MFRAMCVITLCLAFQLNNTNGIGRFISNLVHNLAILLSCNVLVLLLTLVVEVVFLDLVNVQMSPFMTGRVPST